MIKLLLIIILVFVDSVFANNLDPQVTCLISSAFYENKYNLPKNILTSISIIESGQWFPKHGLSLPWPWTININGKGYYLNSYDEAARFLKRAIDQNLNVDIGCNQINWKMHGHNFRNPEQLLHPKYNAAYAAYFLIKKYKETGDWNKAIAYYHSKTKTYGMEYLKKVQNVSQKLLKLEMQYLNYLQQQQFFYKKIND
jgi:tetratricopeptide (TPR) repeat protein